MDMHDSIVYSVFMVFTGAAFLATLGLYARQSLLVVYIAVGVLLGPWGLGLVRDAALLEEAAHIGIIFLLFLLGLDLKPQDLIRSLRQSTVVTGLSSLAFGALGAGIALGFGFGVRDAILVGVAAMFSSTIIGVKLLPTTALHHQHVGQIIISVLLLQDILAIVALMVVASFGDQSASPLREAALLIVRLPLLVLLAFVVERYILNRLLERFDRIPEYLFLLAIGWCLGMAQLAAAVGLSTEVGAFVAGVAVATHPIAVYIAQSLRPLRDFFLVLFFFSLGAQLDLSLLPAVLAPALVLTAALMAVKPLMFRVLLAWSGESARMGQEVGVRLGQLSEFSFLIALAAVSSGFATTEGAYLVKIVTVLTFIVSSYWVVLRYPTPIAVSERLRRD